MTKKLYYSKTELESRSKDIKLNENSYREALNEGMNLTAFLEQRDPSTEDDGLDAFERQLARFGIRTQGDHTKGIYADKVERFYASDTPQSWILFPEYLNRQMRMAALEQDFTADLIANTVGINADVYRTIYADTTDVETFRMKRVTEGAEVPTAKLLTRENTINLYKYGVRLEATYEAVRRMQVDQLQVHLNRIALQTNLDKMASALAVIINGDGNNNAAPTYPATAFDSTSTTGITWKAWIGWLMELYPYIVTTVAGNKAAILEVLTLQYPQADPLMILSSLSQAGGFQSRVELQPGVFTTVKLIINDALPAKTLVGIDRRFAIEKVDEIGGTMTETDKIIRQQLSEIVMTEVTGFGKIYTEASQVLTYA